MIGVPRNGSGRPMEDGLGLELGTSAALGLEKMTRQQFAISKLNKSKCKKKIKIEKLTSRCNFGILY